MNEHFIKTESRKLGNELNDFVSMYIREMTKIEVHKKEEDKIGMYELVNTLVSSYFSSLGSVLLGIAETRGENEDIVRESILAASKAFQEKYN